MRYAEREVSTKHPVLGELKFTVQVPQYDSEAEYQASVPAEDRLKFTNGNVATGSVNGARAYARSAEVAADASKEAKEAATVELIEKARAVAKQYTPTGSDRGPSKKEKLATFDALMERVRKAATGQGAMPSEEELLQYAEKFGA